jgi:hypothetical protein
MVDDAPCPEIGEFRVSGADAAGTRFVNDAQLRSSRLVACIEATA